MAADLNCTHPLASAAPENASTSEIYSLLLKEEQHEFLLKIPALIFMILYVCLGIPGNILVIVVYHFRFRASTTKTFIVSLSIFDLISCMLGIPFEMVDLRYDMELDFPALCKTLRFFVTFCACGSTTILLSVATDRFRRICRPYSRQMTIRQSKIAIGSITALSFVVSSPTLVLYGRKSKMYRGVTLVDCTIDDAWNGTFVSKGFQFLLGFLWISSILVLCVMYGIIIYKIRQQEIWRLNLTSTSMASVNASRFNIMTSSVSANYSTQKDTSNNNNVGNSGRDQPENVRAANKDRSVYRQNSFEKSKSTNGTNNDSKESNFGKVTNNLQRNTNNNFNRMFSRDVNPIYEEDDETHKREERKLDDVLEVDHSEEGADENVILDTDYTDESRCSEDIERLISNGSTELGSMVSSSEYYLGMKSSLLKNREQRRNLVKVFHKKRSKSYPCISGENNRVHFKNVSFSDDETETLLRATRKRTKSLPKDLGNGTKQIVFLAGSGDLTKPDVIIHHSRSMRKPQTDIEHAIQNDNGNSSIKMNNESSTQDKNDRKFSLEDKSIDRLTSRSDQTNGSILTLQDSKTIQENRRRTISAYSMARETSCTSGTASSIGAPSSKASICSQMSISGRSHKNSVCSQVSIGGRSHKNSVCSQVSFGGRSHKNSVTYSRSQSVASSSRELKASRIAVMMCHVTVGHILSYLPHLAIQFHRALGPFSIALLLCNSAYFVFHHILLRSIYLNNAINPIIYSYNNKVFRQYCKQLLKRPLSFCKRNSGTSYTVDSNNSLTLD